MNIITYKPIGVVHSPFKEPKNVPIQPRSAEGIRGYLEIFEEYIDGLKDLDGFSHIILLYHFHLSKGYSLKVIPYMDNEYRGVFATRAPRRPNPIGISVLKLIKIENNILEVKNIDVIDGTPILDIKPYVPEFDVFEVEKKGWLEKRIKKLKETRDDGRFI